jgi:hypothetical protein
MRDITEALARQIKAAKIEGWKGMSVSEDERTYPMPMNVANSHVEAKVR